MSMALAVPKLLAALPNKFYDPFNIHSGLKGRLASDACDSCRENDYVE
ncbi:hypothetical protein [Rhizobium sp. PAMB 3182]